MMYELPLFPLNSVLFPGMPINLHIFEPRYLQMMQECRTERKPFGVVLIRKGQEALGPPAEPHLVGCTAEIVQVQELPGGRLNVLAMGKERFRIQTVIQGKPYLSALVESYPLPVGSTEEMAQAGQRLRPWVERYIELLSEASDAEISSSDLPEDPLALGFLAATVLQAPSPRKQELLASEAAGDMLAEMRTLFRYELPMLRILLTEGEQAVDGPASFSLN